MQFAKEMLWSDQANCYMNPMKSETNNSSAFEQFSVPNDGPASIITQLSVPNDVLASTMSSFLSQLTVVPNLSFLHFHAPTNATSTTTELSIQYDSHQFSLYDIPITHVSKTTATTTATLTQVPATRSATMNAPKYQLGKCNATQAQRKTRNPNILHPVNMLDNNATSRSLFLRQDKDNSEIMAPSRRPRNYGGNSC